MNANKLLLEDQQQPFGREGYALMGAVFEVYGVIGGGLAEEVYQQSLERELDLRGIPYESHPQLPVFYKEERLQKGYVPDLYVHGQIVVELRAVSALAPEHEAQLFNYMRISRKPIGYLINFGSLNGVEWKRRILNQFLPPSSPSPKTFKTRSSVSLD
jgi:GxxExxY protein